MGYATTNRKKIMDFLKASSDRTVTLYGLGVFWGVVIELLGIVF